MTTPTIRWQSGWQPCDPEQSRELLRELHRETKDNPEHPLFGKSVQVVGAFLNWYDILILVAGGYAHVHLTGQHETTPQHPPCVFLGGIDAANEFIQQWRKDPTNHLTDGDQPWFTGKMDGIIIEFLREDRFRVRLADGQEALAVMPEEFLPLAVENQDLLNDPKGQFIRVTVEFREPPALHRITHAHISMLSGS